MLRDRATHCPVVVFRNGLCFGCLRSVRKRTRHAVRAARTRHEPSAFWGGPRFLYREDDTTLRIRTLKKTGLLRVQTLVIEGSTPSKVGNRYYCIIYTSIFDRTSVLIGSLTIFWIVDPPRLQGSLTGSRCPLSQVNKRGIERSRKWPSVAFPFLKKGPHLQHWPNIFPILAITNNIPIPKDFWAPMLKQYKPEGHISAIFAP